jgi:hypothetical protein
MFRRISARVRIPRPATVIASIALVAALGGTAAIALPGKNTVRSGDIVNGAVGKSDLDRNSVGSAEVRNDSLDAGDIHVETTQVVEEITVPPDGAQQANPTCPSGVATGGGWRVTDGNVENAFQIASAPLPLDPTAEPSGWLVGIGNTGADPGGPITVNAYAVCVAE